MTLRTKTGPARAPVPERRAPTLVEMFGPMALLWEQCGKPMDEFVGDLMLIGMGQSPNKKMSKPSEPPAF